MKMLKVDCSHSENCVRNGFQNDADADLPYEYICLEKMEVQVILTFEHNVGGKQSPISIWASR